MCGWASIGERTTTTSLSLLLGCQPLRVVGLPGPNQCPPPPHEGKFLRATDTRASMCGWASIGEPTTTTTSLVAVLASRVQW